MKRTKKGYYVVWEGLEKGVFNSWNECRIRVEGFTGAKYMGFATMEEARLAFAGKPWDYFNKQPLATVDRSLLKRVGRPIIESICVDAACSGNPGILEYRGVNTFNGEEIFHRGPYPEGTTNIGEFLAIVTGLAWLHQQKSFLPLYSDSRNGILWVKQKRVNTKLERHSGNEELFKIMEKALEWLHNNSFDNPVLKWETAAWGEIPADFGRK